MTNDPLQETNNLTQQMEVTRAEGPVKRRTNWWGIAAVVIGVIAFALIQQPVETIVVGGASMILSILGVIQKTSGILGKLVALFGLLVSAGAIYAGFAVAVSGVQPF